MSRTIKVSEKTHEDLEEIREKRETFADVVARLVNLHQKLSEASEILGPAHIIKAGRPEYE